jgi:hypothetical protein
MATQNQENNANNEKIESTNEPNTSPSEPSTPPKKHNDNYKKFLPLAVVALVVIFLIMMLPTYAKGWLGSMNDLFTNPSSTGNTVPLSTSGGVIERTTTTNPAGSSTTTINTAPQGGAGGGGTTPGTQLTDIANNITKGETKDQVLADVKDVTPQCLSSLLQALGKQEVCTFTKDGQILTVTFLDGQVIGSTTSAQ